MTAESEILYIVAIYSIVSEVGLLTTQKPKDENVFDHMPNTIE